MKKIICALLAAILLTGSLAACSNKQPDATSPHTEGTTSPTGSALVDNVFGENDQTQTATKATDAANPAENQQGSGSAQSGQSTQPTQGQQNANTTQPTENQQASASTQPAEVTTPTEPAVKPTETTAPTEKPTEPDPLAAEYEAFTKMNSSQKKKYQDSFASTDAFLAWYAAAAKAYQEANPPTEIPSDGNIPLN